MSAPAVVAPATAAAPAAVAAAAPAAPAVASAAPTAAATTAAAPAAAPATTTAGGAASAPAKTSLYVGDLNTDVTEGQLFDIFTAIGPVSTVRVCRHAVTRESLGYAYVNFQSAADAEKAVTELNYSSIKGRPCRIMWSQRDPSLRRTNVGNVFVKNLGPAVTSQALHETCKIFGTILSCKVATDPRGSSKGYGFVHFEGEEAAKKCIEVLNGMEWAERVVECKPYVPRAQRAGPEWNNLYVKNLPAHYDEKALQELFTPFGEIVSSKLVCDNASGKSLGFGFVCFKDHKSAVDAERDLNGKEVDGAPATLPPKVVAKIEKANKASTSGSDVPDKTAEGSSEVPSKKEEASEVPDKTAGAAAGADADSTAKGAAATATAADAAAAPRKLRLFVGRAQKKSERERALREARETAKRERVAKFAGCNLYVRNLDETVDDDMVKREFGAYGTITSAMVARDPPSTVVNADGSASIVPGRSKLFGYVCFSTPEEASKAIAGMHKRLLAGKPLYVQLWQSKDQRAAAVASSQRVGGGVGRGGAGANNSGNMAGLNAAAAAGFAAQSNQALAASLMAAGGMGANPLAALMGGMANPMLAAAMQSAAAAASNPQALMAAMQGAAARGGAAPGGGAAGGAAAAAAAQQQQQQQLFMFLAYLQQMQLSMQQQAQAQAQAAQQQHQHQHQAQANSRQMQAAAAAAAQQQAAAVAQQQQRGVAGAAQPGVMMMGPQGAVVNPAAAAAQQQRVAAPAGQVNAAAVAQQQQARKQQAPAAGAAAAAAGQRPVAAAAAAPQQQQGGRAIPGTPGAPSAAAVAAGTAKASPAQGGKGAAAGQQGAQAPGKAAYNAVARNVDAAPAASQVAAAVAPAASTAASFASQLASATPEQRKNMIGERLYGLISVKQGSRAGKITGMLLEGMDEGELLHLLESPADLDDRIHEALEVLAQATTSK